jgi:hypothetical protein
MNTGENEAAETKNNSLNNLFWKRFQKWMFFSKTAFMQKSIFRNGFSVSGSVRSFLSE